MWPSQGPGLDPKCSKLLKLGVHVKVSNLSARDLNWSNFDGVHSNIRARVSVHGKSQCHANGQAAVKIFSTLLELSPCQKTLFDFFNHKAAGPLHIDLLKKRGYLVI